jgi:LPPG:FO 2-phospho-L-lactate transferase
VEVVLLAGGTGGAKLARGLLDEVGAGLTVIGNTGDDIEIHGGYVSPDPDLITFWLADRIDERGWGLQGDTFQVMDGLRELGDDVWFNLGDRDLALCLRRARRLAEGARLTDAIDEARRALGVPARVLPMADEVVRTRIRAGGRWQDFQAYMIRERGGGPIEDIEYRGAQAARAPAEALDAIARAAAIVIGPSNPVLSIWPILAVPALRAALQDAPAPVVAVSPLVRRTVLKGPTAACLAWAGVELDAAGVAEAYAGLIDGLLADEPAAGVPTHEVDVDMPDAAARRRVARAALELAASRDVRAAGAARRARTARAPAPGRRPGDGRRAR